MSRWESLLKNSSVARRAEARLSEREEVVLGTLLLISYATIQGVYDLR